MAYFNSLSDWKSTQEAVAQHTTDVAQASVDAKAKASQASYEGYSHLLESGGGGLSSLSGGIHLTRKIYKKFKAAKQTVKDAKDAASKAKSKLTQGQSKPDAEEPPKPEGGEEPTGQEPPAAQPTATPEGEPGGGAEVETGSPPKTDDSSAAPEGDDDAAPKGEDDAPTPEGEDDAPAPEGGGASAEDTQYAKDIGGGEDLSPEDQAYMDELGKDDHPSVQAQPSNPEAEAEPTNPEVENPESGNPTTGGNTQPIGDGVGGEGGGETGSTRVATTEDNSSSEPPSGESEPTTDAPPGGDAPVLPGEEGESNIEAGAKMFGDVKPTPSSGLSSLGGDADLADVGSAFMSDASTALTVGMEFLGPIGEVVGAGIALGGFFHSLFDSGEEAKEKSEEGQATAESASGGISTTSLQTASATSNTLGSTV